jgi:rhodanese-related sulfurtransferase
MQIKIGYEQLVAEAEAQIETISVQKALTELSDSNTTFVDLRDVRELKREGRIPGALHVPRGMLEFWIDPASPYHKAVFAEDRRFIFYCNLGWRSALAAAVSQRMGLENVCHIEGGFDAWVKNGGAVKMLDR